MNVQVSVSRNAVVLVSEVYPILHEGDLEKAVSDALKTARLCANGAFFDYDIHVGKEP